MLASRTTAVVTAEHDAAYPDRWGARVTLTTTTGGTLVAERALADLQRATSTTLRANNVIVEGP
jgi:hypothetical protein